MNHILELLAFATGPAFLLVRRGWWAACCAAGWYQAAQSGQTIDDKAAFAMGRSQVIATLASAGKMAFDRIEWAAIGAGLALAWKDGREHLRVARDGVVRDMHRFWAWVSLRHWEKHELDRTDTDQRIALLDEYAPQVGDNEDAGKLVGGVLTDMEQRRAVLAARLEDPTTKSPVSDVLEHTHIVERLRAHYRENPADAIVNATATGLLSDTPGYRPQALLGVVTGGLSWKLAAASAGLAVLFFGLWRIEDAGHDRDEAKLKQIEADSKALTENRQKWVDYATGLRGQITQASASTKATTATIEAERARARAAEARKRKTDEAIKAAAAGGPPPSWDSLLNDEAVTDTGQPTLSGGSDPDPSGGVRPVADHTDASGPT